MTIQNDVSGKQTLQLLSDEELVKLSKHQLPYVTTAYEVLIARYQKTLLSICYRHLNSMADAEDVTHEVMLKVFRNLGIFKERSSFKTWLFRIAYNESMNLLRKRNSQNNLMEAIESERGNAESNDSNKDSMGIGNMLYTLNTTERTIVIFRTVSELEFVEIAKIVDMKLSAVKMRYRRALEKLRKSLTE